MRVLYTGLGFVGFVFLFSGILFVRSVFSLGSRMRLLLRVATLVPRRVAHVVKEDAQKELDRMLEEMQEEEGEGIILDSAGGGAGNASGGGSGSKGGLANDRHRKGSLDAGPGEIIATRNRSHSPELGGKGRWSAMQLEEKGKATKDEENILDLGEDNDNDNDNNGHGVGGIGQNTMSSGDRIRREARKALQAATRRSKAGAGGGARTYVDTTKFEAFSISLLLSPIAVIGGWVAFLVLYQLSINEQARIGTVRMSLVEDVQRILADFVVDVAHLSAQNSALVREDTARKTTKSEVSTLANLNPLVFGGDVDTADGIVHVSRISQGSKGESLMFSDACSALSDSSLEHLRTMVAFPNSTESDIDALHLRCLTLDNGILAEGTYGAVIEIVANARRLQVDRPRPDLNRSLFFDPERRYLHKKMADIESPFVRFALAETSNSVEQNITELIQNGRIAQLVFNVVFACVFAIVVLATDGFLQSMLDGPIRSARSLLAFMPSEVVQALPPLRVAMRAVATEVQLISKGRDASSFQQ